MTKTEGGIPPEQLTLLLDAIQDYAIFLLGPTGEIRSWNSGAARTLGYPAGEIIGSHFSRFYGPEDLEAGKPQAELDDAASSGRIEDEGWRIRKDGTRFWANTIITALRDSTGGITGFAKVTRDLTRHREADERLRQSEEMFRLLVDSVQDYAIFMLDPEGRVVTWNAGAQRIKGYSPAEIIGRHFSTFYSEADIKDGKPERELDIARRLGSVEDEGWRLRRDGSRFWANVVITAVFDRRGSLRGFAKVTRDMTDRKRAEEMQRALFQQREARLLAEEERQRAEASYRAAQESSRAKDEFLMTLSHELRTPMTSILGWARLLPTLSPNETQFREAVAAIGRSAQHQAHLIDDVLDVSRIVSGKLRLNVAAIDVLSLLEEAVEGVRPGAAAKSVLLTTSLAPDLGKINADATRLNQIIWNLLTNAVKFTPKNGHIDIRAQRTASHLEIAVADTGEGIDRAFLPHVFEAFRQAENPSTRVHGGLGLGLSIVRYLVEAHGGTVAAESRGLGHGATFTVSLPVAAVIFEAEPDVPTEFESTDAPDLPQRLAGTSILIVDDDAEGRHLVQTVLRRAGAAVTAVESAAKALEALSRHHPDLVLTDIAMPQMDGYTLARRIHEQAPELNVVALSAFPAGRPDNHQGLFDAYITKPVEPTTLIDSLATVMGR